MSSQIRQGKLGEHKVRCRHIGAASAGRARLAADASAVASNPAGLTLLDPTQLPTAAGALRPQTNFDLVPETITKSSRWRQ